MNCAQCFAEIQGRYSECKRCGGAFCSQRCFSVHWTNEHAPRCGWCSSPIEGNYSTCKHCGGAFCNQCFSAHYDNQHAVRCNWCSSAMRDWTECRECRGKYCSQSCFVTHVRQVHNYHGPIEQRGEGCYITTAVCAHEGKADDCAELTTLRQFRDHYLLARPETRGLVAAYYATAPALVRRIEASPDRDGIYGTLRTCCSCS